MLPLAYLFAQMPISVTKILNLLLRLSPDPPKHGARLIITAQQNLRDSHDLSESLQYVLESVPTVDRAFVHSDYAGWNIPSHMNQQSDG